MRSRFGEALPFYQRACAGGEPAAAWRHDLVVRLLFTLKKERRFEEAAGLAQAELARWSDSPDFFFTLGDLLLDWALAEPRRAAELLPQIEASWQRAVAIGERPELPDSVRGRGSFLAAHNLAAFHQSLGNATQAAAWRERAAAWRAAAGAPALDAEIAATKPPFPALAAGAARLRCPDHGLVPPPARPALARLGGPAARLSQVERRPGPRAARALGAGRAGVRAGLRDARRGRLRPGRGARLHQGRPLRRGGAAHAAACAGAARH